MAKAKKEIKEQPVEQVCWASADKLRKNMDTAEYKHIVLELIFLKYISNNFYELSHKLEADEGDYVGADSNDPYEYRAENNISSVWLQMMGIDNSHKTLQFQVENTHISWQINWR